MTYLCRHGDRWSASRSVPLPR